MADPADHPVGSAYDAAREQIAQAIFGSWQVIDADEADLNKSRIMSDGVLWRFGVPAVQRTADHETIAQALRKVYGYYAPVSALSAADAVLAVLIPADLIRAEALDEAVRLLSADGYFSPSIEARAAEYRAGLTTGAASESDWADYFEQWGSTVGAPPFTQEAVVATLRGPRPFGVAAGFSTDTPEETEQA